MSELKATTVYDAYWTANSTGQGTGVWVYLKAEADKAFADLEESHKMEVEQLLMEIVELKDKLQNVSGLLKETREWLIESQRLHKRCADGAIKKIRHSNFKRCVAMAVICFNRAERANCWKEEVKSRKRFEKWLELAERFKEAK